MDGITHVREISISATQLGFFMFPKLPSADDVLFAISGDIQANAASYTLDSALEFYQQLAWICKFLVRNLYILKHGDKAYLSFYCLVYGFLHILHKRSVIFLPDSIGEITSFKARVFNVHGGVPGTGTEIGAA